MIYEKRKNWYKEAKIPTEIYLLARDLKIDKQSMSLFIKISNSLVIDNRLQSFINSIAKSFCFLREKTTAAVLMKLFAVSERTIILWHKKSLLIKKGEKNGN